MTIQYTNIDERYGEQEQVTINDYMELNPSGIFSQDEHGIYEEVDGRMVKIAE